MDSLDGETLWCADRAMGKIHRLDPEVGEVLAEIDVPEPELHGLTMHEGALIFLLRPQQSGV